MWCWWHDLPVLCGGDKEINIVGWLMVMVKHLDIVKNMICCWIVWLGIIYTNLIRTWNRISNSIFRTTKSNIIQMDVRKLYNGLPDQNWKWLKSLIYSRIFINFISILCQNVPDCYWLKMQQLKNGLKTLRSETMNMQHQN